MDRAAGREPSRSAEAGLVKAAERCRVDRRRTAQSKARSPRWSWDLGIGVGPAPAAPRCRRSRDAFGAERCKEGSCSPRSNSLRYALETLVRSASSRSDSSADTRCARRSAPSAVSWVLGEASDRPTSSRSNRRGVAPAIGRCQPVGDRAGLAVRVALPFRATGSTMHDRRGSRRHDSGCGCHPRVLRAVRPVRRILPIMNVKPLKVATPSRPLKPQSTLRMMPASESLARLSIPLRGSKWRRCAHGEMTTGHAVNAWRLRGKSGTTIRAVTLDGPWSDRQSLAPRADVSRRGSVSIRRR